MKKLSIILIGLFVVINLSIGSIAGFTLFADSDAKADNVTESVSSPRSARDEQTSPDSYDPSNIFYLCSPTITTTIHFLKGVPYISDGSDENLNKCELVNGAPTPFYYPAPGKRPTKLKYNQSFTGNPFISLVLNSYADASKTVVVTLGIDTNNNYDEHNPTTLEHRAVFPPYQTIGDFSDGTMEEEYFEAFGEWQGGTPPSVIHKGRVILEITMTSPNGNPALVYCGFNNKLSWLAAPYMHTDLVPQARINDTYRYQGYPPADPIMVGDRVYFDGSDSFDPNDDTNGNEKIDTHLGEVDRLRYKWDWGDGTTTNLAYDNNRQSHIYAANKIPTNQAFRDFQVNLTVMDPEGHADFNSTWVRIYRGNHSPEINSLKINNVEQINGYKEVISILDKNVKVWFSAVAIDKDNDDMIYSWDFDNDDKYDLFGTEAEASTVFFIFSEPTFKTGQQTVKLNISDGTLAPNTIKTIKFTLTKNIYPVPIVRARREFDKKYYEGSINAKLNEVITFYSNESYDPDNRPGFDIDNDNITDYHLKYRWTFNKYDPQATSGWTFEKSAKWEYTSSGTYEFEVVLDIDDGVNITNSEPFIVKINVRPVAKITIEPDSYNNKGSFELNRPIYFNGTSSYDPNFDILLNYTWEIGSGDNAIKKYGGNIQHKFTEPGGQSVSLKVYDGEFWSTTNTIKVDLPVLPDPPIVRYEVYPTLVNTSERVYFDAGDSTDPDSDDSKLTYSWYFGDGSSKNVQENNTIYKYTEPGEFIVTLVVTDDTGMNSTLSNVIVEVKNRLPTAKIKELKNIDKGDTVQVYGGDSSDYESGTNLKYIWSFSDDDSEISTNDTQVNHTFKSAGTFTIELTVQDEHGGTAETSISVTINEPDSKKTGLFGMDEESSTAFLAGIVITIIIVVVIIVVLVVLIRTRESI